MGERWRKIFSHLNVHTIFQMAFCWLHSRFFLSSLSSRREEMKPTRGDGTGRWCEKLTISIFNNSRSSRTETIIVDLTKPECEFSLKRFPSIFSFLRELSVVAHVRRARGRLVSTLTSDGFSALLSGRLSVS